MMAYLPEFYADETFYSWACRYYAHSGYPSYVNVLEDLLENRYAKIDMEFIGKLNLEAKEVLDKEFGLEKIIREHTMLRQYTMFSPRSEVDDIVRAIRIGDTHFRQFFRNPDRSRDKQGRRLRYCPCCVNKDRKRYGEAYWHRSWMLKGISICSKHRCRLQESDVEISSRISPRLFVAEQVIPQAQNAAPVLDERAYAFASFVQRLFEMDESIVEHVPAHQFLASKLEGTPYISTRGQAKQISRLFEDLQLFYQNQHNELGVKSRLSKLFEGKYHNPYGIWQLAFFLGISPYDLNNRVLPEKSQTIRFNERVKELYEQGEGCYRIAEKMGCSPSTALKANRIRNKAGYAGTKRKGKSLKDWARMDRESAEKVKALCERIYHGSDKDGRPGRVTKKGVNTKMGWPERSIDRLPQCLEIVLSYDESKEEYWAREIEWAQNKLSETKPLEEISPSQIWKKVNLRKKEYERVLEILLEKKE